MLQLAAGVSLGVNIGNLFQLQAALHRHGVIHIAANEENAMLVVKLRGHMLNMFPVLQGLLQKFRQLLQRLIARRQFSLRQSSQQLAKTQGQQIKHRQLSAVSLGGGHGNFRAGPGVKHIVRLAGNGGTKHVHNRQHVRATLSALSHCRNGVGRFTGLGNHNHQRIRANDRAAITEFRGNVNLHRNPRGLLQNILAHRRHVI